MLAMAPQSVNTQAARIADGNKVMLAPGRTTAPGPKYTVKVVAVVHWQSVAATPSKSSKRIHGKIPERDRPPWSVGESKVRVRLVPSDENWGGCN